MTAAVNQTSPQQVLDLLNRFEQENPIVGDPGQAPNIWDDVIPNLDGYNEFATQAADPKDRGEIIVVQFVNQQVVYEFSNRDAAWSITHETDTGQVHRQRRIMMTDEKEQVAAVAVPRGFKLIRDGGLAERADGDYYPFEVWAVDSDDGAVVTVTYKRQPGGQLTVEQIAWAKPNAKGRGRFTLNREPSLLAPDRRRRGLDLMLTLFDRERDLPEVGQEVRVDPRSGSYNRGKRGIVTEIDDSYGSPHISVRFLEGRDEGWTGHFFPCDLIAPGKVV